jgi:putative tricarboxylic transport membrane protein
LAEAGPDTEKLTSLVGGNIDGAMVNVNQARQYVEAGKVAVLAVLSRGESGGRSPVFPNAPSFVEAGYKNTFFNTLMFLFGPKDMPASEVKEIGDYFGKAARNPEVLAILTKANLTFNVMDDKAARDTISKMSASIAQSVIDLNLVRK